MDPSHGIAPHYPAIGRWDSIHVPVERALGNLVAAAEPDTARLAPN